MATSKNSDRPPGRPRRANALREARHLRQRGLYLGSDLTSAQPLYLAPTRMATHLHLLGPTGTGKSRMLLWLFQLLCHTRQPIILADFKGGLFNMARDWSLSNGLSKRLVLFDLNASVVPGYNPLRENGLRLDLQAQWVAEGVKSAWGQATFDATPQLARFLYLVLFVSRALRLSLVQGLDVLRPSPTLRHHALERIRDPFVHGALRAFDQLTDRRKEEVAASTLARLEAFCRDEIIRTVICSPQSLDLETVLTERRILLLNFAKYQPLLPDPLKLLARMFTRDLLAHVYKGYGEGKFSEHHPVYFICDEVQNMATRQLCDALDEGRGVGLHCLIGHQHLCQLADEDQSGYLLRSVLTDARTKILFGDLDFEDLDLLAKNVILDRYDPWRLKDEIRTPLFVPVETTRISRSRSRSRSRGRGLALPRSVAEGESVSTMRGASCGTSAGVQKNLGTFTGRSRATTVADGTSYTSTEGVADVEMEGESHMEGSGQASGTMDAHGVGSSAAEGAGMTMTWDPYSPAAGIPNSFATTSNVVAGTSASDVHADNLSDNMFEADGTSSVSGTSTSFAESDSESHMEAITDGESAGTMASSGVNLSQTFQESESTTTGSNRTVSTGITPSLSTEEGYTESETESPFHEYHREDIVSSRTYLTPEEQRLLHIQQLKDLPMAHFCVKVPGKPAVFVRAPWVETPHIGAKALEKGLARVYALPFYMHLHDQDMVIDVESSDRQEADPPALPPSPAPTEEPVFWQRMPKEEPGGVKKNREK